MATPLAEVPEFEINSYGPFLQSARKFLILLKILKSLSLISDKSSKSALLASKVFSLLFVDLNDLSL